MIRWLNFAAEVAFAVALRLVPHCDSRHGLWTVLFPFAYIPLVPTRFWRRVRG
jgi:hypothetical protein